MGLRRRLTIIRTGFGLLALVLGLSVPSAGSELAVRRPLAHEPLLAHDEFVQRLVVKFRDEIRVRPTSQGQAQSLVGADLSSLNNLLAAQGCKIEPLIRLSAEVLERLESRAAARSGVAQPDLAGMVRVECPGATSSRLVEIGTALEQSDRVEWVALTCLGVPPPTDLAPPTPDLVSGQTYLGGNPGVNSDFAWTWNARGAGVRVSDCEYGWNPTHEDLNEVDLHLEPGQTIHPDVFTFDWDQHGTSVAGICLGLVNAYGCNGMAPEVSFSSYPEWTVEESFRRETCIANAIAGSAAGDIVLLEMQTVGPGGGYAPAEVDLPVWTLVKAGTDAGVVVVGAAGNGNQNLDSAPYAEYMSRGDSGAILIGAGTNSVLHNKLSFSSYGTRVDVQAWGQNVRNVGYGDLAYNGSDTNQWYTNVFSGTSSASAIAAPSCALIQSFQLSAIGTPLSPASLCQLLIDTGWPQGTGGHIGPAINIKNALETQFPAVGAPEVPVAREERFRVEPNPFREEALLQFTLQQSTLVELEIVDVSGRRVRHLLEEGRRLPGVHELRWDGRDEDGRRVAAGVYFAMLRTGETVIERRMVRMK